MIDSRQRFARSRRAGGQGDRALRVLGAPRRPYGLDEAYAYCRALTESHKENVPIASRFMPAPMRPHVRAIYAFFRVANDLSDRDAPPAERLRDLARWDDDLHRAFLGEADHPIFTALQHTVERCALPRLPFEQLLTACRMDQAISSYATFAELRCYLAHACEPMGQLLLYTFGHCDPMSLRYAADACAGLQLTNLLQDLDQDVNGHRHRVYLPQEDLHHFGVDLAALQRREATPTVCDLLRFQVSRARGLLDRGRPLLRRVGPALLLDLSMTFLSAAAVLDKIEAAGHDVFTRRPVLSRADRAAILARARALAQRGPHLAGRPPG